MTDFNPEFVTHDFITANSGAADVDRARYEEAAYRRGQERVHQEQVDQLAAFTLRTRLPEVINNLAAQNAIAGQLDERGKLDV